MTNRWITLVGLAAAAGTTGAWLPQVYKTLRTRSARDFSWAYLAMFTTGVVLWIVYGVLRNDVAVFAANVVALVLIMGVVAVKVRG